MSVGVEWLCCHFDSRIDVLYVGECLGLFATLLASAIPARVKGTGEEGGARPRLCLVDLAVAVQETHHCLVTQDTFHTGCGETPTRFARTSLSGKGKKQNISVRSLSLVSSRSKFAPQS